MRIKPATAFLFLAFSLATFAPAAQAGRQVIVDSYFEETIVFNCNILQRDCIGTSSMTPSGKYLDIQQFSCSIVKPGDINSISLGASDTTSAAVNREIFFNIPVKLTFDNNGIYKFVIPVIFKVAPAKYVKIRLEQTVAGGGATCVVTGNLS